MFIDQVLGIIVILKIIFLLQNRNNFSAGDLLCTLQQKAVAAGIAVILILGRGCCIRTDAILYLGIQGWFEEQNVRVIFHAVVVQEGCVIVCWVTHASGYNTGFEDLSSVDRICWIEHDRLAKFGGRVFLLQRPLAFQAIQVALVRVMFDVHAGASR